MLGVAQQMVSTGGVLACVLKISSVQLPCVLGVRINWAGYDRIAEAMDKANQIPDNAVQEKDGAWLVRSQADDTQW